MVGINCKILLKASLAFAPAQAMWFSASADLAVDATRDFRDIGAYKYDPIRIHDLRKIGKLRAGLKLEEVKVITFCFALQIRRAVDVPQPAEIILDLRIGQQ